MCPETAHQIAKAPDVRQETTPETHTKPHWSIGDVMEKRRRIHAPWRGLTGVAAAPQFTDFCVGIAGEIEPGGAVAAGIDHEELVFPVQ